ncbi:MAG: hypothetical protein ACM3ON_01645 [Chloroflexota bacterium]|jgi:nitrogenase subunit NifH
MRTRVRVSASFVEEYKKIVRVMKNGGDPPCVACSNRQVITCAKTGHQCEAFVAYVDSLSEELRMIPQCAAGVYSTSRN